MTGGTCGQVESSIWFDFDVVSAFSYDFLNKQTTVTFCISSDDEICFYNIQGGKAAILMHDRSLICIFIISCLYFILGRNSICNIYLCYR